MRSMFTVFVLGSLLLGGIASAATGNPKDGQKASAVCAACHGADGNKTLDATYPKLAGQYADYLVKVLQDYRSGARVNIVMNGQAANLKDQDIADIAAWYSTQASDLKDLRDFK